VTSIARGCPRQDDPTAEGRVTSIARGCPRHDDPTAEGRVTSIANAVANFPWVADAAGGSCGGGLHDPGLGCDTFVVSANAHCMLVGSCPVSVPAAPDAVPSRRSG
jgi:hypothetical protein